MAADDELALRAIIEHLEAVCGIFVPAFRMPLVASEVRRLGGQGRAASVLTRLRAGDAKLLEELAGLLAVGETYLFRGPGHYRMLQEIAEARQREGRSCHVLCAGCATGEEAWSAAAVLADVYRGGSASSVVGWDLSLQRITIARTGKFRPWSVRTGLMGYDHHFSAEAAGHAVRAHLRPLVTFEVVNLVRDLPFPRQTFDVVFFRNVGIYWSPTRAQTVATTLLQRLTTDGYLFVGPADPIQRPHGAVDTLVDGGLVWARRVGSEPTASPPRERARAPVSSVARPLNARATLSLERKPVTPLPMRSPEANGKVSASEPAKQLIESAYELANGGRTREALELLDRNKQHRSPEAALLSGILAMSLGELERAAALFRECVYWDPSTPHCHKWLALAQAACAEHGARST
jgi:chemotaxis methyl-accepting protein methylase